MALPQAQRRPGRSTSRSRRPVGSCWGGRDAPPAITVVRVAGLAHPDFLVEIDATAVVPADV